MTLELRQTLRLCCILLMSACTSSLYAAEDTSGRVQTQGAEALLAIDAQIALFEQRLLALESQFGPYDPNLIEVLADLGRYYSEIGQFQRAGAVFERALSITRISDGLYSAGQLAILENLIDAYKAAGDWDSADDKEHLALHINTRLYEPGSQAYADAVLAFGDWKIQAARGNLMQRTALANMRDIDSLADLYRSALGDAQSLVDTRDGMSSQTHFDLLYGQAYAEAQLASYSLHNIPFGLRRPVQRYISEYVCRDVVSASGQVSQSCGTVRRENPQYREYEMQRQLFRDRVRLAVTALQRSIDAMQALLEAQPALQNSNSGAALARLEELRAIQSNITRDYRRSVMRW